MSRRSEKPANRRKSGSSRPDVGASPAQSAASSAPLWRRDWFAGLALAVAALAAYQQVWHAGFIWDDEMHLTANPVIVGPLGLADIWTSRAARICPLVLTTFWFEHALWGLRPLPYHLVNVLVHGASAVALWQVLRSLRVRGAWLGAALWALHPVQAETVAWITELKNTQSCLLYLLAIFFYLRWEGQASDEASATRRRSYVLALLFAALAMASKSSTVVLPLVLGLCAWWRQGRLSRRTGASLVPLFLMSAAASALTIWTQHLEGANDPQWARAWFERIAVTGRVFWFYLGKLVWPHPLVFIYPRWNIDGALASSYVATAAMCLFMGLLWWGRKRSLRAPFFCFAYFLVALLPVLGVFDQFFWRYSFVGDHFQYLASMGPLALAAAGIATAFGLLPLGAPYVEGIFSGGLLLLLGVLSWRQSTIYRNVESLWRATLAENPRCWMAYNNLGLALAGDGSLNEAVAVYERALELNPEYAETRNDLGMAFLKQGKTEEAVLQFRQALRIKPGDVETENNLGNAFMQARRMDEAVAQFRAALALNPDFAETHNNLGIALSKVGRTDEAIVQFQRAIELKPGDVGARINLGGVFLRERRLDEAVAQFQAALGVAPANARVLDSLGNTSLMRGRPDEAAVFFRRALKTEPGNAQALNNLGYILLQTGRVDEAVAIFQDALDRIQRTEPRNTSARIGLGRALLQKGQADEAAAQFQRAVEIEPGGADGHFNLANAFLQGRKPAEAIAQYQRTLELSPRFADARNNLANALLQVGRLDEAISQYRAALEINPNNPDFHRNLGAALEKNGQRAEAEAQLQEASRLRRP